MNEVNSPKLAKEEITRRGLPVGLHRVWDRSLPPVIQILWQAPQIFFRDYDKLVDRVTVLRGACPLWEENGEAVVALLANGRYIRFYYEDAGAETDPNGAVTILGRNQQQFAAAILVEFEESGLRDHFQEVAEILGFRHTEALCSLLDACDTATGEAQLSSFLESIA